MNRPLVRVARALVPLAVLVVLAVRVGTEPFTRALHVLTPATVAAALLLGAVATTGQAMRWRAVTAALDPTSGLTRGRAVEECYRAAMLNLALPSGVIGDANRAWRARPGTTLASVRTSAGSVVVERVIGTAVVLVATAIVTIPLGWQVWGAAMVWAVVASLVALPGLRRMSTGTAASVLGWTVLSVAAVVALFVLAAYRLGTVDEARVLLVVAFVAVAAAAVPLSIGGFGPREAATAVAFPALGLTAEAGVATSAAFGVLALVSTLPGAVLLLRRGQREEP